MKNANINLKNHNKGILFWFNFNNIQESVLIVTPYFVPAVGSHFFTGKIKWRKLYEKLHPQWVMENCKYFKIYQKLLEEGISLVDDNFSAKWEEIKQIRIYLLNTFLPNTRRWHWVIFLNKIDLIHHLGCEWFCPYLSLYTLKYIIPIYTYLVLVVSKTYTFSKYFG